MTSRLLLAVTVLMGGAVTLYGELEEQECPTDCHCHYFRVNWVTDCSESNLTTIPRDELSPNVYILDMNGNNVERISPFPGGIKMRRLQMARNHITGLNRESFAGLIYLLDADFSYNLIGAVDPEAFSDSPGLITLELQNNPLRRIDGHFLNSRSLHYLDLSSCRIRRLSGDFFRNTTALNKLDLSHNRLGRIEPGPFDHLTNLERLKLNDCGLVHVSPEAFARLENLRELEMSNNHLKTIDWRSVLLPLNRVERLDLRNSGITNLPGDAFAENLYLRELNLADNELWHLDVGVTLGHNLRNLRSLDLSNCNLKDRLTEEAFRNASKLRVVHLDGNPLSVSDLGGVLHHLPKLQKLTLSDCGLKRLPDAFHDLEHLQELRISHNPLSDDFVSLLNDLRSLEHLDISYSNLSYVGNETFAQMTMLKRLILSGNKLRALEEGLFANLGRLESLELEDCDLRTPVNPNVFGDHPYTNVVELKLGGNPLLARETFALIPWQLSHLERLDLSNCDIRKLSADCFANSPNLTSVNLSGNGLSSLDSLAFLETLRRLERLDLRNNNLTRLQPRVFEMNPGLVYLNLIGNPFVCDCNVVEVWDWVSRVKNDLRVLVGSRPAYSTTGNAEPKQSLMCAYDSEGFREIIPENRHEASGSKFPRRYASMPQRTWAKYVRESNCP